MKTIQIIVIITVFALHGVNSVRLHKIFQFIDGFKSEHNLQGFLHVGNDYSVFIRLPRSHDKYITYELYETTNVPDGEHETQIHTYKPPMVAIAKVPVEYIKEQLKTYRNELYKAKYMDDNIVPGTQVMSLREWQIAMALRSPEHMKVKPSVLRTVV